jgi:type I restriction enzyme M protein
MKNQSDVFDEINKFAKELAKEGLTKSDFTEQLSCLLFLKMAEESATRSLKPERIIDEKHSWGSLNQRDGEDLEKFYEELVRDLGKQQGQVGVIFRHAKNNISRPAQLKRLITDLIGSHNWSGMPPRIRGEVCEGLIEETVRDSKSKAGEHFTPRPLIAALVDCMQLSTMDSVCDPACGTGGFLLAAYEYVSSISNELTHDERVHLQVDFLRGFDKIEKRARLAQMNLLMNGISRPGSQALIEQRDSLLADPGERWSVVMSNPPFANRSSTEDGQISREDFQTVTLSNAANFLQHVKTVLKVNGRAVMLVPDNLLFDGSFTKLRQGLLHDCELHTILRLHPGIWHKPGVKVNALFFEKRPASQSPWTSRVWFYDFRTNLNFSPKKAPLRRSDLDDFVTCFEPGNRSRRVESERFKPFSYEEIMARADSNLDIFWLEDESVEDVRDLPPPEVIIDEMLSKLDEAIIGLKQIRKVVTHERED